MIRKRTKLVNYEVTAGYNWKEASPAKIALVQKVTKEELLIDVLLNAVTGVTVQATESFWFTLESHGNGNVATLRRTDPLVIWYADWLADSTLETDSYVTEEETEGFKATRKN